MIQTVKMTLKVAVSWLVVKNQSLRSISFRSNDIRLKNTRVGSFPCGAEGGGHQEMFSCLLCRSSVRRNILLLLYIIVILCFLFAAAPSCYGYNVLFQIPFISTYQFVHPHLRSMTSFRTSILALTRSKSRGSCLCL